MNALDLINYLERRIQKDEEFFLDHQDELNVEDSEQKEIYDVTQGKVDMCRQMLGYLEELRQHPEKILEVD
jgi:hypothetical protein